MSFRSRLVLGALVLVLLPLGVTGLVLRSAIRNEAESQQADKERAAGRRLDGVLRDGSSRLRRSLDGLSRSLAGDNATRTALVAQDAPGLRLLRNRITRALGAQDLAFLRLQDEDGVILASGHFPEEYGVRAVEPVDSIPAEGVFLEARTADGVRLVFANSAVFRLGDGLFRLTGGTAVDRLFESFEAGGETAVILEAGGSGYGFGGAVDPDPWRLSSPPSRRVYPMLVSASPAATEASLTVRVSTEASRALLRRLDRWLVGALAVGAVGLGFLAAWGARRLARPIADLVASSSRLEPGSPAPRLPIHRKDEVGELARVVDSMSRRAREEAHQLRDAERRAALGDLARQINHDLKNGVAPLRNTIRHLAETNRNAPNRLRAVFQDRLSSLEAGVDYLDALAVNVGRLSVRTDRERIDLNRVVRKMAGVFLTPPQVVLQTEGPPGPLWMRGEATALRRILENLIRNAVEAVGSAGGTVTVKTAAAADKHGVPQVLVTVADTGPGMTPEVRSKVLNDYFTTKPDGAGLGLSIVRRLVADFEGRLHIDSAPGEGTRINLEFPEASLEPGSPGRV